MRSQLEPMKKVARMLRAHRSLLVNWFRARGMISAGVVEGFNNKAKLTTTKAYQPVKKLPAGLLREPPCRYHQRRVG
jgi:transposase